MKKEDSFIKLFDRFISSEGDNEVKKDIPIDEAFLSQLSSLRHPNPTGENYSSLPRKHPPTKYY